MESANVYPPLPGKSLAEKSEELILIWEFTIIHKANFYIHNKAI